MKISLSYITNFKPANFSNFNNLNLFKNKNKKKIISRNFFLFLLLLKYANSSSIDHKILNTTVFVKPFYKKFITSLRAPYRHKLSRHQFILSRYHILCTIKINTQLLKFNKDFEIFFFIKQIKKFYV